jgi:hypothetical protein
MKKELPMRIIAKVGAAMQILFGTIAEEAGKKTRVVVRKRKFTCITLAKTFVLGYLQRPNATDEQLARMAIQCGAEVTPQAIDQRHSPKLVKFFEEMFRAGMKLCVESKKTLAPILDRFTSVKILDSTTTTLPDSMANEFPGCGGSYNGGKAAVKLQTELDLRHGGLEIEIEPGRSPDSATSRQWVEHQPGSLRITDLGYFNLTVFAAMSLAKAFFLSRLQFATCVKRPEEGMLDILPWLLKQRSKVVDQWLLLGKEQRLPSRLIAFRVPKEQANRRRRKLRKETLAKRGQEPSDARLAWCDWMILVTNVPADKLTVEEVIILYRARWQIELLFKRWKSQDLVATLSGSTDARQMIRVWARLLAALVQHWLVVASSWGDPTKSWAKVSETIRDFAKSLLKAMHDLLELEQVIAELCKIVGKNCKRDKRSKPGTAELLNDVNLLDFCLT